MVLWQVLFPITFYGYIETFKQQLVSFPLKSLNWA